MHYFKLYVEFVKVKIMGIAEYRQAFIVGALAQFVGYGAQFLLLWLLLDRFDSINGWSKYEVILLFSFNLISYALAAFFLFNPTMNLSTMIKNGTFDEVLTKPLNSLLYLVCREFNSAYFSHLLLAGGFMTLAFTNLGISFSVLQLLFLIVTLIGAALIQGGLMLLIAVPAFWIVENSGLLDLFFRQARNFIQYPISIYNNVMQIILTFVLPYAFINFFPAQFFLGKDDFTIFHASFQYLTPVVGLLVMAIAYFVWLVGIKNYKSTGS